MSGMYETIVPGKEDDNDEKITEVIFMSCLYVSYDETTYFDFICRVPAWSPNENPNTGV